MPTDIKHITHQQTALPVYSSKHANPLLMKLKQQLKRYIPETIDGAGVGDNLIELGLDSLHVLALVNHWRANGIEVSFRQLIEQPTLAAWLLLLSGQEPTV